jgi:hypothetical protein
MDSSISTFTNECEEHEEVIWFSDVLDHVKEVAYSIDRRIHSVLEADESIEVPSTARS